MALVACAMIAQQDITRRGSDIPHVRGAAVGTIRDPERPRVLLARLASTSPIMPQLHVVNVKEVNILVQAGEVAAGVAVGNIPLTAQARVHSVLQESTTHVTG